jgi:two-component system sensor histidine kinase VicK
MRNLRRLWLRTWAHPAGRYIGALLLPLASAAIRTAVSPFVRERAPFAPFFPAVVIVAWLGGLGPGIVAVAASMAIAVVVLPSVAGFDIAAPSDQASLVLFLATSMFLLWLARTANRARAKSETAEQRVHESREMLWRALGTANMGYWIWEIESGKMTSSENLERIHGLPAGSFDGTFGGFLALLHPEDRSRVEAELISAASDGEDFAVEYRTPVSDETVRWILARGHVVSENGKRVRVIGLEVDLTEQKRSEKDLRLLAAIVSSSDDAIISKDLDGRILSWNAAAETMFGYSTAEAVGQSIRLILPPERADDFFAIIDRVQRGERVEHYETVRRRRDGSVLEVSLTVSPIRDESGAIIGASKIARDITAVKAAQRERQRMRDLYLGILGHDLRNPLNTIAASVFTLEKQATDSTRGVLSRISRSAARMGRMIEQLLDFTRARLGEGIPLSSRPANLGQICSGVLDEFEVHHPRRIRFEADGSIEGQWDPDRLAQAISNLVSNALEHGAPEGPVDLRLSSANGEVRMEVSNRGAPIPPELRSEIFEPFRRGTPERRSAARGLGLGLYIAREIVRAHSGTIELDSGPEKTTFLVRLPPSSGNNSPN